MSGWFHRAALVVAGLCVATSASAAGVASLAIGGPLLISGSSELPSLLQSRAALETQDADAASAPAVVDSTKPSTLRSLVAKMRSATVPSRELECLAGAIYFESKSEPLAGQLAVGQVIANRAKSGRFPSSYCGVVFQRGQFSFVRNRQLPSISRSSLQWRTAVAIAQIVDQAMQVSAVPKALFFHARYVAPRWGLTRLATVGNHVFYR